MKDKAFRFSPTLILLIINFAVYLYTSLLGQNFFFTDYSSVLSVYGQNNRAVLYGGQWWQLVTAMFVHVNIIHITSNMFFLLLFGLRAEALFTDSEYYVVYLASGLAGNLLTLLYPLDMTSAGASGAILGLFGAVIIYLRKAVGRSMVGALLFAFMFFLITLGATTNIFAHFGGLVIGLGVGYWIAERHRVQFSYQISY